MGSDEAQLEAAASLDDSRDAALRRVVIVDPELDPEEFIISDDADLSKVPCWSISELCKTFFPHRSAHWVRLTERSLGAMPPRRTNSPGMKGAARSYDLWYVERFIHRMASNEMLTIVEVRAALTIVRQIAIVTGVIPAATWLIPMPDKEPEHGG